MKKIVIFLLALAAISFAASNTATVNQTGDLNAEANIDQVGSSNKAVVTQSSVLGVGSPDLEVANVKQNGKSNEAYVTQIDGDQVDFLSFEASVNQKGEKNKATQKQNVANVLYKQYTRGLYATIKQDGNRNNAIQDQQLETNLHATINQNANDNVAKQTQGGWGKTAVIKQNSNENIAEQTQFGGNAEAVIEQSGNKSNRAYQVQNGGNWKNGLLNKAMAKQIGKENYVKQNQMWTGDAVSTTNVTTATQVGNFNTTNQTQTGYNLSCVVKQMDSLDKATTTQNGSNLNANIYQH